MSTLGCWRAGNWFPWPAWARRDPAAVASLPLAGTIGADHLPGRQQGAAGPCCASKALSRRDLTARVSSTPSTANRSETWSMSCAR